MACNFCTKAPLRNVRDLDQDVAKGNLSISEIAVVHGLKEKTIRIHMNRCLGGNPITGYAMLQKNLRSLEKLAREIKEEYDQINPYDEGSGAAKGAAMQRLISIRREQRESIVALDRIKPSDQLMDEIIGSAISPLISSTTEICTDELRRLRKTLAAYVEVEHYHYLDAAIKDALLRIGERLYQEQLQIQPSLKKILHSEHASKGKSKTSAKPRGKSVDLDKGSTLH